MAPLRPGPPGDRVAQRIAECLPEPALQGKALAETRAKYVTRPQLREQLMRLAGAWPEVRGRLRRHLLSFNAARDMLREAGCAFEPEQIGIPRDRLRASYEQAYFIRRRFTVLDFAEQWNLSPSALGAIFGQDGTWPTSAGVR